MVQVDVMFVYYDVALHHHFFEAGDEPLAEILQIMIANNQMDLSIQAVEHICPFCSPTEAEVSKVKYVIVLPTTQFQFAIIVSFISSMLLKGRLQNFSMLVWLKCVSEVKNTLLPSKVCFTTRLPVLPCSLFSFMMMLNIFHFTLIVPDKAEMLQFR